MLEINYLRNIAAFECLFVSVEFCYQTFTNLKGTFRQLGLQQKPFKVFKFHHDIYYIITYNVISFLFFSHSVNMVSHDTDRILCARNVTAILDPHYLATVLC